MDRPIQLHRARQGEIAAFLARQREDEAKAAQAKTEREDAWKEDVPAAELEFQAWEQAAEQLLGRGEEIFGSEAAAHLEFDRLVNRRLKIATREIRVRGTSRMPGQTEKRAALSLALRQAAPLILLLIVLGAPVALFFGSAGELPILAAIAGLVWHVHSRMMANLKEMLAKPGT